MKLGLDIGGTKTAAAVLGDDGSLVVLRTAPSGYGAEGILRVASALARDAVAGAGGQRMDFVGACMPGLVDRESGVVRHAVNLGVDSINLAAELESELGMPVVVENDVKAAALGAHGIVSARAGEHPAAGSSHGPESTLAYLNLGTGMAAAVVLNGEVLRGADGMQGEIGHFPVGGKVLCPCGQVGCLETLASGSALSRMWPRSEDAEKDPFAAALSGDETARRAASELCRGVALAIQLLALSTGAERILIGGGMAALGAPLTEGIRSHLRRRARGSRFVESLGLPERFELFPSDIPLAALGAAALPPHSRAPTAVPAGRLSALTAIP
jgi:glucokinase